MTKVLKCGVGFLSQVYLCFNSHHDESIYAAAASRPIVLVFRRPQCRVMTKHKRQRHARLEKNFVYMLSPCLQLVDYRTLFTSCNYIRAFTAPCPLTFTPFSRVCTTHHSRLPRPAFASHGSCLHSSISGTLSDLCCPSIPQQSYHRFPRHTTNVFGLVPDRGRVTDHPESASYFSK